MTAPAGNRDGRAEFPHLIGATTVTKLTDAQRHQAGVVTADHIVTRKITFADCREILQMLGLKEADAA